MLEQIGIGLFGVAAVFLSQDVNMNRRRYACLFGLVAQPFWFYATWKAHQWGIFALSFLYAASWLRGFANHWLGIRI
ncbi:hypothetical protein B0G76_2869 [Paraburkholderia sp. BL23I1N1]|uniref:hypothetical protein n=1 Tax=Paraburkholderia sp. BL23I1N1 TaxID=1938802 RepID=UPI000E73861B|nr:hypothetical protein [Paraburkholderia sp. BL23I1N1]RKE36667.1 hypothetical protein B0G76_2869 [Paraburkholderia sp. BL23I1N1]